MSLFNRGFGHVVVLRLGQERMDWMARMRAVGLFLVCSVVMAAQGCGHSDSGSTTVVPRQIDDRLVCDYSQAEQQAWDELAFERASVQLEIEQGRPETYGFSSMAEYDRAVIGQGERLYVIVSDSLKHKAEKSSLLALVQSQPYWDLTHACVWMFPVKLDDGIRADIRVEYRHYADHERPRWFGMLRGPGAIGTTARRIDEAKRALKGMQRKESHTSPTLYVVEIRALAASVLIGDYGTEERVVFMTSRNFGPLAPNKPYSPQEVLPVLAAEAFRVVNEEFPETEENAHHSSGLCDWERGSKQVESDFGEWMAKLSTYSDFVSYIGTQEEFDRAYPGGGVREYSLLQWGYEPGVSARSFLADGSCMWRFAAMVDGEPRVDFEVVFDTDGTPYIVGAGGRANEFVSKIEAQVPELLSSLGANAYELYYVEDKAFHLLPYAVVVTDKGEFISFGPPPLYPFIRMSIAEGGDDEWFYPSEDILPILRSEWDNSLGKFVDPLNGYEFLVYPSP